MFVDIAEQIKEKTRFLSPVVGANWTLNQSLNKLIVD